MQGVKEQDERELIQPPAAFNKVSVVVSFSFEELAFGTKSSEPLMEKSMRRKNLAAVILNELIKNDCIEPHSSLCIFNNSTCNSGEL